MYKRQLLTHPVKDPGEEVHRSDHYLRVIEDYGIAVEDRRGHLRLMENDVEGINKKLEARGIGPQDDLIVFNTGGNWHLKRWPLALWAQLARRISASAKLKIVFSGAVKDKADADQVIKEAGINAINFAGETTLGESLALFSRAKVVVSADSGPLHLADSIGAATVGIFGPTRPEITGPRGTGEAVVLFKDVGCNQAPCYHLSCGNNVCMQSIGVEDVWQALQKFIR